MATLTGNARVRMTRWSQKLILQVEWTRENGIIIYTMADGSQTQRPAIDVWWEDATLSDLQSLGGETLDIKAPAKLTVVK